jgi:hypothetical protein
LKSTCSKSTWVLQINLGAPNQPGGRERLDLLLDVVQAPTL